LSRRVSNARYPPSYRVLAADVAGYSRLMGADEEGTHERLRAHFDDLVHPMIDEHRCRVVKNTGDGFLAEFASVVDAVRCAVEIQHGMTDREPDISEQRRIRFRIGVNLGDIIVEGDDIFGDGVNIAARLEGLAEPGGVCVSRMVHDNVRDKIDYTFEDLGEQQVKNIARPVRAYALRPERVGASRSLSRSATASSPPPSAPRLSIVVLPFDNFANDPEHQYFADAVTEDLTTDLSRIAGMLVISRGTAFTYQGKRVDTKQIGRELGVRYVLEGSVQRSGSRVRINVQLIDAESAAHLWAERFAGDTSDLFALQDEITSRIAISLQLELLVAETARPTQNFDALDLVLRGRSILLRPESRHGNDEATGLFRRALELDPGSVDAQSSLASSLVTRQITFGDLSVADIERAEALSLQALASAPRNPLAHYARAQVLRVQGRLDEAISEYEIVLAYNRNHVNALAAIGRCRMFIGALEEGISAQQQAIRLSPRDPQIGFWYARIGHAHILQSRFEEAIFSLEKARGVDPENPLCHLYLAAAYGLHGDAQRAAAELEEAQRLDAADNFTSIARERRRQARTQNRGARPEIRTLFETTYFTGLRKAGMPEE
jgi:adenylate cyclase